MKFDILRVLLWLFFIDWERVVRVLSAFLTPLIAAIAVYIAYQQYRTGELQRRLALFDRRLAVFNATMKLLASVVQAGRAELDDCFKFIQETREHEFLFGSDVGAFINEVYRQAVALHAHLAVQPQGGARLAEFLNWFTGRMDEARRLFRKYMDFTKP